MYKRVLSLLIALFMLFLTGCSSFKPFKKEAALSDLPPEAIFVDGTAIFNETLKLLNSAQKSIYVEQATFDDPRLLQVLIEKAQVGVEVRVLLDQWENQKANRGTLNELKNHSISAQFYPAQKGQFNHVKMLVVDHTRALVYGPSWTKDDFDAHSIAVELSGKSAWTAARVFARDWEFTTTLSLDVPKTTSLPEDNITLATDARLKQQLLNQIGGSTKNILLVVTEVSDEDIVQALIDAARKGKEIRLILDPQAEATTVKKLQAAGIQIRLFKNAAQRSLLRMALIDGKTFFFSSSGWTYSCFVINHELSLTAPSPKATAKLVQLFDQDWANSTQAIK